MLLYRYGVGKNGKLNKMESLYEATPKFYIEFPTGEKEPVFDYKTFPFEIFVGAPRFRKKGKTRDKIDYIDLACTFDIESTTIKNVDKPYAFMFQWQYCIEDYVFMGKTWEEFQEFNEILTRTFSLGIYKDRDTLHGLSLVCYVHNLQYEHQFMQHFIGEYVSPLFTDIYEPLIVPTENGITYRCSYRLSNKSLDQFTKGFPHHKLAGDFDYSVIRVPVMDDPKNGLTDLELAYCFNDVKGPAEALRDRFEHDRYNIASIPLTSTGYVRKDCQRSMRKNPKMRAQFLELKLTPHLYTLCRKAFRGGNTHSNARHTNKLIKGPIKHKDETSAYPWQMLTKGFPMSPFKEIELWRNLEIPQDKIELFTHKLDFIAKSHCLLMTVRLIDFEYIGSCGIPYIAKAKTVTRTMDEDNIVEDNGRIFSAPYGLMSLTEIDLSIILKCYRIKKAVIVEAWDSDKKLLPYELRRVVLDYYKRKTALKHSLDPSEIYEYNKAKENLNATYGMICMRIDRLEFEYDHGKYTEVKKPLQEMLDKFYESESSFLPYQWAVWVTAWARYELQRGCDICGEDLLYTDTDSVFYTGDHETEFNKLNEEIIAAAEKFGAVAQNKKGESFPIGVWDDEPECMYFKTLGAKKYLLSYDGKEIEATISGVNKKIGKDFFTKYGFDSFNDSTVIPISGKVSAHYNNDLPHIIQVNGVDILTASNIALVEASYTINLKPDYKEFIHNIRVALENKKQLR